MEENFRFKGFNWFSKIRTGITVGGAGGIGSYVTFLLARAGVSYIDLWDMDIVERHNLGCQLFFKNSLNSKKTKACKDFVKETVSGRQTSIYMRDEITPEITPDKLCGIVFSCFDNFTARKNLFKAWKGGLNYSYRDYNVFIDGRLDGELLQIYCVTKENYPLYESTLNENTLVTMGTHCTMQQTSHVGAMIGSYMVSFLTNFLSNQVENMDYREVPYFFEMFIPLAQTTIISKAESIDMVKALETKEVNPLPF